MTDKDGRRAEREAAPATAADPAEAGDDQGEVRAAAVPCRPIGSDPREVDAIERRDEPAARGRRAEALAQRHRQVWPEFNQFQSVITRLARDPEVSLMPGMKTWGPGPRLRLLMILAAVYRRLARETTRAQERERRAHGIDYRAQQKKADEPSDEEIERMRKRLAVTFAELLKVPDKEDT